ncbi:3'-5' exonuclease [Rhodococcus sp. NPDC058521]|uniref:3'-5' exonuclease n=1 Tax=Rhodococcus sp. NPDC058521 TaxID=3346536 RepID=UPI00365F8326
MHSWSDRPICAFDLETTGRDPHTARIVSASVVVVDGAHTEPRNWILDPGVPIPDGASQVHGISSEYAREHGVPYREGYLAIRQALDEAWARDHVVVAFNASYDLTLMHHEGLRLGYPDLVTGIVVDPYVIDRQMDKRRKGKRTLGAMCEHYGIALDCAHEAQSDALAAAELARSLAVTFPHICGLDIMTQQTSWHAERQADFAAYLVRQGRDASDVNGEWPIRRTAG